MKLILTFALLVLSACGPTAGDDEAEITPKPATLTPTPHAIRVPPIPSATICPRDDAGVVMPTAQ
jgi:hypothetical protein